MNLDWKHWVLSHIVWIVGVSILVVSMISYARQRESLARAEQFEKDKENEITVLNKQIQDRDGQITGLKTQMDARDKQTQQQIAALEKLASQPKTPEQVVQSLPVVTDLPLNARTIPNSVQIAVDPQPLFTGLVACKEQSLELDTCQKNLTSEKQVEDKLKGDIADKQKIIDARTDEKNEYKKVAGHRGFFGKVWDKTKELAPIAGLLYLIVRK